MITSMEINYKVAYKTACGLKSTLELMIVDVESRSSELSLPTHGPLDVCLVYPAAQSHVYDILGGGKSVHIVLSPHNSRSQ